MLIPFKKLICAVVAAATLCSCATTPAHYVKPGGSEEELQRTLALCRNQAMMVPEDGWWGVAKAGVVKENCLRSQGWVRDPPCDPNWNLC